MDNVFMLLTRTSGCTSIGLDLGASAVRAAQLVRSGTSSWSMLRSGSADLSLPSPAGGSLDETDEAELTERIRACTRNGAFRGRTVVAGLDARDADFHLLELPQQVVGSDDEQSDTAVQWEVVRLMNAAPDAVEVRYWPLPPPSAAAPTALGVGTPRERVERVLSGCRSAGLSCSCVDTPATALSRFGSLLQAWSPEVVWGILDLGRRQTRLLLCVDEVPVLVRKVGSGGSHWTQRIAESLQLSPKAAEIHKRQNGIAYTGESSGPAEGRHLDSELATLLLGALRGELNEIAAGVKRSYEYALSCYSKRRAGDLVLVGGGASMGNLAAYWSDVLGIGVRPASDYLRTESCRLQFASGQGETLEVMATAIGLAVPPGAVAWG